MWVRKLRVERITPEATVIPCPIGWIDNFAMRNFTNDAIFDDTLPVADGLLEAGFRIPVGRLRDAMEDWFRRKGYLAPGEGLRVEESARCTTSAPLTMPVHPGDIHPRRRHLT